MPKRSGVFRVHMRSAGYGAKVSPCVERMGRPWGRLASLGGAGHGFDVFMELGATLARKTRGRVDEPKAVLLRLSCGCAPLLRVRG